MLISDFRREAHTNFQIFFVHNVFFSSTLTSNRRQFHVKLKSILNHVSIDVFNHKNATNIKNKIILGV